MSRQSGGENGTITGNVTDYVYYSGNTTGVLSVGGFGGGSYNDSTNVSFTIFNQE